MLKDQTQRVIDRLHDCGLLRHRFTDYMRDYELLVDNRGPGPATPEQPDGFRVVFRNCVYAESVSSVRPGTWRTSLGDQLLDADVDPHEGYVWGIRVQFLDDAGGRVIEGSARAAEWTGAVGIDFCEVELNGNAHDIRLVYSGITLEPWDPVTLDRAAV